MDGDVTRLIFALHFHQPYGNLDEVFAGADERCYRPTLELLARHPHVSAAVHVSGPLLDWLAEHGSKSLELLRGLVERGQVEILGGGYQEPMLAILPDRDARGQLVRMAERCEELLGARPRGMWLAERVWEPDLPRPIAEAGYRYTLLDDTHLHAAGVRDPLGAYYVTDKAGATVAVLPIDRGLRTRIPFADVDDLMGYLREQRGRVLTYGDDAEKFGLWPTTFKRVWQDGWLEAFCQALGEQDFIETVLPSEVLDTTPSAGAVYIPTISYAEMGAWALPAASSVEYQGLAERLDFAGLGDAARSFLRGGIWQAFLAKYPESNVIYRKMLRVSQAVARGDDRRAEDALYRGQCNCAYWHGLFGGLYLQHLRAALMAALIEAENLVDRPAEPRVTRVDHDGDLQDDLLFEGPELNLYVAPARGGSGFELDLRQARHHLTGVLGRRYEAYHVDVPRARVVSDEELGNISAHDLVRATEEGLADKLVVDRHPRGAFVDHLLPASATLDQVDRDYRPLVDIAGAPYTIASVVDATAVLSLSRAGLQLCKRIAMGARHVEVGYRLEHDASGRFACEIDLTLLTPTTDGGRRIVVQGSDMIEPGARAEHREVSRVAVKADSMGIDLAIETSLPATLWRIPIETVSQSERGFERAYQGTALWLSWPVEAGVPFEVTVRLALA